MDTNLIRTPAGAVVNSDKSAYMAAKKRRENAGLLQRLNNRVEKLELCVQSLQSKIEKLEQK